MPVNKRWSSRFLKALGRVEWHYRGTQKRGEETHSLNPAKRLDLGPIWLREQCTKSKWKDSFRFRNPTAGPPVKLSLGTAF